MFKHPAIDRSSRYLCSICVLQKKGIVTSVRINNVRPHQQFVQLTMLSFFLPFGIFRNYRSESHQILSFGQMFSWCYLGSTKFYYGLLLWFDANGWYGLFSSLNHLVPPPILASSLKSEFPTKLEKRHLSHKLADMETFQLTFW